MIRWLTIAFGVALWARRGGLRHVIVHGRSMQPTLCPGDRLVLIGGFGRPRVGQLVLAADPRAPSRELLKRVHATGADGVDLRGDDPRASTDSRAFGSVPPSTVRAYVAVCYAPVGRRGRVHGRRVAGRESPTVSWWRARAGRRRSPTRGLR